ncbi:MAG: NHL repeat-containing protein, partial [Nitrospiraceae bacterium]|nr:NHL repeat-containing protein [Nitrospiraceae bacterium]
LEIPSTATSCATTNDCPLISLGFTPAGIAVDSSHNVWVTNDSSTSGSVTKIPVGNTSCSPPSSCKTFSGFTSPTGIAVDTSGNVWVTNSTGNSVTEIPASATSCSSCKTFSGFTSPTGIAVDTSGNVWVTNDSSTSGSVTEIPFGTTTSCSSSCPTYSGFSNPVAVAFNPTGTTPWIANSGTGTYTPGIVEITEKPPCVSSSSSGCPEITHFTQPVGLAFDSSGNLWVIDAGTKTTVEITSSAISSAGCSSATPCYQYSLPAAPKGIATNSQGIWISLSNAQVIEYKP